MLDLINRLALIYEFNYLDLLNKANKHMKKPDYLAIKSVKPRE